MFNKVVKRATFGFLCVVFLISLIWVLRAPALAQPKPQVDLSSKKVLILHSFAYGQPVYKIIDQSIEDSFVSSGLNFNNLYFEFLDLARNLGQEYRTQLADGFRRKYQGRAFDLAVAVHQQSLEFLLKEGRDFYPEGPIIQILGDPVAPEHFDSRRPLIYFPFSIDVVSTVKSIFALRPDTQKILVIAGSIPVDRRFLDLVQAELKAWKPELEVEYTPPLPLDEILKKAAHLPPRTAILYTNVAADSTGKTFMPRDVARMISRSANVPVFGLYETLLGDNGVVGGIMLNHRLEGERAVRAAEEILRGKLPSKPLTILKAPLTPMFDWQQLDRWGFRESALPANAIILNKPVSPWERYKFYILGSLAFIVSETALIAFLIVHRRRRKVAEEELDQFFNVTLDLLGIANTDGYFLRLNPAMERLLGYTREELTARPFFDFVHPDDLDSTREAVSTLAAQQKIFLFENRYRCKDGTYRWLEWSSAPAGRLIYAAARDITEKKRGEEALEERLRFEELLSNISSRFVNIPPDRVDPEIGQSLKQIIDFFKVDRCALLQILADETSWQITHVAAQESVPPVPQGTTLSVSINPWAYDKLIRKQEVLSVSRIDDLPAEANVDKQTWNEWGIRSNLNIPIILGGPVNHVFAINSVKSERVWPEESIPRLRLLGEIFVNALERKRAEAEVNQGREQLLHVERLLRLNEMTASLAHELNQPLTAILNNAQAGLRFLQSGKVNVDEFREILQDIIQDDQRAGNVIRSLRSMMKREEGERNPIIINDVFRDVTQIFNTESVFRNVHIDTEFDESLPPVLGDKVQLQQVVLNLIVNAADAMVQNPPEQRKIILRTQVKNDRIRATVRDFGPGIDKKNLERIFEPFFTTKGTGLGMGLVVSQTIIETHEGHIWAENNPDGGASFFFELPVISSQ